MADEPHWGISELSFHLNIKKGTVYSHLSRGVDLPPFYRIGSSPRWRPADVRAWVEKKLKEKRRKNFES